MSHKSLDHYTYRVTWSPEDGEYVALCTEFPLLSWLATAGASGARAGGGRAGHQPESPGLCQADRVDLLWKQFTMQVGAFQCAEGKSENIWKVHFDSFVLFRHQLYKTPFTED